MTTETVHHRIARAIEYLVRETTRRPSLESAAAIAAMSPGHFTRSFRSAVGLSPKRFLEHLTVEALKQRLKAGSAVLEAQLDSGLSSPGRVHDHFVNIEAVTPGEYRRLGSGMEIRYGLHPGPAGDMLLASTTRGLCFVAFTAHHGSAEPLAELTASWPGARLIEDGDATAGHARTLQQPTLAAGPVSAHVRGTNFQVQVWRALLRIPEGTVVTYGDLARSIGRPTSVRAVASAVGANPLALVIPCHRVIRSTGALSGYRWTPAVKSRLLALEAERAEAPATSR